MQSQLFHSSQRMVAGIDEAGRGPLAGPVVAAAVILRAGAEPAGLRDSKKLSESKRESLAADIRRSARAWAVGWADRAEIDAINILNATYLAMRRAILGLSVRPDSVLVDGNRLPSLYFFGEQLEGEAIVGGDDRVAAISAASILAKTTRDEMMRQRDRVFPMYAFSQHKGYGTALHRERLDEFGPCSEHRQSFGPIKARLAK